MITRSAYQLTQWTVATGRLIYPGPYIWANTPTCETPTPHLYDTLALEASPVLVLYMRKWIYRFPLPVWPRHTNFTQLSSSCLLLCVVLVLLWGFFCAFLRGSSISLFWPAFPGVKLFSMSPNACHFGLSANFWLSYLVTTSACFCGPYVIGNTICLAIDNKLPQTNLSWSATETSLNLDMPGGHKPEVLKPLEMAYHTQ